MRFSRPTKSQKRCDLKRFHRLPPRGRAEGRLVYECGQAPSAGGLAVSCRFDHGPGVYCLRRDCIVDLKGHFNRMKFPWKRIVRSMLVGGEWLIIRQGKIFIGITALYGETENCRPLSSAMPFLVYLSRIIR